MKKIIIAAAFIVLLFAVSCAPVKVVKTYQEKYVDKTTGKEITYTESIEQVPEKRMPIHLTHPELYE